MPQNNPKRDIARKLASESEWFLVGEPSTARSSPRMAGYEGHRGWINYSAVHPDHQRQGFARELMQHAEAMLRAAGCPKINLQVRGTNAAVIALYESMGFAVDNVVGMGKRLEHDS
ncbi:MAG: GNAT family acetyltransferase [Prosthecobacter sp.]